MICVFNVEILVRCTPLIPTVMYHAQSSDQIRVARPEDLPAIVDIYNSAVLSRFETADMDTLHWKRRISWFRSHAPGKFPLFVYERDREVAGWASVSSYRMGRKALRYTAEISYYVHPLHKRQGIGTSLLRHLIEQSSVLGFKSLLAIVLDKNTGSIQLLIQNGFEQWGHLPEVADFEGVTCGHNYYGLQLPR